MSDYVYGMAEPTLDDNDEEFTEMTVGGGYQSASRPSRVARPSGYASPGGYAGAPRPGGYAVAPRPGGYATAPRPGSYWGPQPPYAADLTRVADDIGMQSEAIDSIQRGLSDVTGETARLKREIRRVRELVLLTLFLNRSPSLNVEGITIPQAAALGGATINAGTQLVTKVTPQQQQQQTDLLPLLLLTGLGSDGDDDDNNSTLLLFLALGGAL